MIQAKDDSLIQALLNNNLDHAKTLIKKGKSFINQQNEFGLCALHVAVTKGWYDMVQLLLKNGADPNLQNELYDEPTGFELSQTFNAISEDINTNGTLVTNDVLTEEVIRALKDTSNRTALHIASNSGHFEIAKLLLEHGALVDIKDLGGCTPLHWAAVHGNVRLMKLLLDRGANVNQTDIAGSTPLHETIRHKKIEASKFLLEKGANPELSDIFESSAVELAKSFPPIFALIVHYSASISEHVTRH